MPQLLGYVLVALFGYLVGAIPFGYLVVKLAKGQDIRAVGSGRTGGTNVVRAAGPVAGALTGVGDVAKGVIAVWGAGWLASRMGLRSTEVAHVCAGLMAVIGHNYSILTVRCNENFCLFNEYRFLSCILCNYCIDSISSLCYHKTLCFKSLCSIDEVIIDC